MALTKMIDLKALLASFPNLPKDLQKRSEKSFKNLEKVLKAEKDSEAWYRAVSDAELQIARAIVDTSIARAEKKHPDLKKIKKKDRNFEQKRIYGVEGVTLSDQILEAKYANHPNWKLIEKTFSEAKADLIAELKALNISESDRIKRLEVLEKVTLSLPYSNPEKLEASGDCATTVVNAFYDPSRRKFTVCAGLFNAYQSRKTLYMVIAHELSHSVDPVTFAHENTRANPAIVEVNKLVDAPKAVFKCEDWEKVKGRLAALELPETGAMADSISKLADCLAPKSDLKPYTPKAVEGVLEYYTRKTVDDYATKSYFTVLAQPTKMKDGKPRPNDYYRRPDRLISADTNFIVAKGQMRQPEVIEIFNQELECVRAQKDGKSLSYQDLPAGERTELFAKAIQNSAGVYKNILAHSVSYCGQNCASLVPFGLAKNPQENFADWLAARATARAVSRANDLSERRDFLGRAAALFCREPGLMSQAQDLTLVEKQFSSEEHPDDRIRRWAIFNARNAKLAGCDVTSAERGFGTCEP